MAALAHEVFVYDAVRTPRGRVRKGGGSLANVHPHELLAGLMRALSARGAEPATLADVIMGVSTPTGEQAADVARVAIMAAGWPDDLPAGTVSRMCCSGLDAIASGAAQVASGMAEAVVVGGVESMSRVPMFSDRPAFALDEALGDVTGFVTIGVAADATAHKYGFTREDLDQYAVSSHERSAAAVADPSGSVIPVVVDGAELLATDEGARPGTTMEQLGQLPALFGSDPLWERVEARLSGLRRPPEGLHTVGTAPQLCDGASAAILGSAAHGAATGREAKARVLSWAHSAVRSPGLDATLDAADKALTMAGTTAKDVKVAEFNESFSMTPLLLTRELGLDPERVNARGGAVALGHPLGASGGILLATAIDRLHDSGGGMGLLVIPAALGLATALAIEVGS